MGKYTIGVELAARTGFRLLHNHLTVNLVSAVFERDSDAWLRLLRSVRRDMFFDMFSPAPFGRHLCLDITHIAPSDATTAIIQHYGIRPTSARLPY